VECCSRTCRMEIGRCGLERPPAHDKPGIKIDFQLTKYTTEISHFALFSPWHPMSWREGPP
jgi:hypothetical protein